MDRVAEVLDVLGGHDPCDDTDCMRLVSVPAPALFRHRLFRQVSGQFCGRLPGSRTESPVEHSWIDVGSLMRHVCLLEETV
jgi:hypothetical protein